jgi:outer membrane protein OmpA-like peptidoglycan-associated protein/tetratricopeptide (TPR) repeat protein
MKRILSILLVFIVFGAKAQYDPEKVNKKAKQAYDEAWDNYRDGNSIKALELFKKAVSIDPNYVDALIDLGGLYGELKDYKNAITTYETARDKDTTFFKQFYLQYSLNLAGEGRFQDALNAANRYLDNPKLGQRAIASANARKKTYEFALQYAAKHTSDNYVFAPINLGDSINSDQPEYYPSMTINDSILVYTRRGANVREDFFESNKTKNGYSPAKRMNGDLNDDPFKGALHISQDGEWLIFAADYGQRGYGSYDLYICYWTPQGWSVPENMGPNVNSDAWESSPSLSPDKKALYFSSTRFGGYGQGDLYVCYKTGKGWTPAQNLGPTINTAGGEIAPFVHADGETMYFTSDGHPGYGGTDLYMTKLDRATGKWGTPQNLGYPINTIENEGSLFVAADGVTAYYASDRADSRGGLDLYKFELRKDIRPVKTLYVQGYVYDANTKKGLPSSVELIDNKTNIARTRVQTDETGFYFITLPVGNDYTFTVNRQGYLFYSKLYELSKERADSTYRNDIPLQPIEMNATVRLKNIQFENNSVKLIPISLVELDKLVQLMQENPQIKIQVNGYTDNVGAPADNLKLSNNRAKAVADYLMSKGVDAKRLTWKGFGETKPIGDNKTEEGRALNRRTEFTIIGM